LPDVEFNRFHNLVFPDGSIAFGSFRYFALFRPDEFGKDVTEPKVVITSFVVNDKNADSLLYAPDSGNTIAEVRLPYNRNFIQVGFSAMEFALPWAIEYRYRMEGLDNDWVYAGNQNVAKYPGLAPGRYRLLISATDVAGKWAGHVQEIVIVIAPPWWWAWWAYLIYAAILVLAVSGIYRLRLLSIKGRQKELEKLVSEQTEELKETIGKLEESSAQKDVLMKEVHHRVKNNLQVISALLNLQLARLTDESLRATLEEGITRISSVSLLHNQLYKGEQLTNIEFSAFARELKEQISSVYDKPAQSVTLQNEIPETWLDIDTALPLGLILNELMTNSYKYAFAGIGQGTITLKLERGDAYFVLSYFDNGAGLPADLDLHKTRTLGLTLIRSLSKQLAGSFSYDRDSNVFVVRFKELAARKAVE